MNPADVPLFPADAPLPLPADVPPLPADRHQLRYRDEAGLW
ncbi:hypothetical protein [Streptomyces sp. NBC_01310]